MNDKLSPEEWFERFPELKDSLETSRKHEEIRRTIFPIIDQDSDLWFMLSSFLMASAAIDRIVTFVVTFCPSTIAYTVAIPVVFNFVSVDVALPLMKILFLMAPLVVLKFADPL